MTLYPWLQEPWRRLPPNAALAHALLFVGPAGIGKGVLVRHLAMRLLCATGDACGHCRSCHLITRDTHPDLLIITAADGKNEITVDDVRAFNGFVGLRPHLAPCRVAIIDSAERLNRAAANALLKVLEEPPADTYILLASPVAGRLPPTLRSRCQRFVLAAPPAAEARRFLVDAGHSRPDAALARARGAPLRALALPLTVLDFAPALQKTLDDLAKRRVDAGTAADRWYKSEYEAGLLVFADIVGDMVRSRLGITPLAGSDPAWLQAMVTRLDLKHVFRLWDKILEGREAVDTPLDKRLIWEDIFLTWEQLTAKERDG
ncbi:MAG: DNA polymerase III subunit delta' [Acidiferrobacter sp.]